MIYRLGRKFILISAASIFGVILVIFVLISVLSISSTNSTLDDLTDSLSKGNGRFPEAFDEHPNGFSHRPMGPETRFSTRHYTVWFDQDDEPIMVDTEFIHAVDPEEAVDYAEEALEEDKERGWLDHYRYKVYDTPLGSAVVFVDGSSNLSSLYQSLVITLVVLVCASLVILLLIALISKRVMKPVAESYEKQKQFITDANHELKTPLTLILTNLDIAEQELGENEWLQDIRSEGQRMTGLVNQLVALSRMDEEGKAPELTRLAFSELVADTVSEFEPLLSQRQKHLQVQILPAVTCTGNEPLLRRLVSILMDNAAKYCDEQGTITVTLQKQRQVVLTVENTYKQVADIPLDKLFDRFYRADKARTYTGSYGIGLSMAKSIAEKHHSHIIAYQKDDHTIGFKVTLKP